MKIYKEYILGDMVASYRTDEEGKRLSLYLLPLNIRKQEQEKKELLNSLVQYKIVGDIYEKAYVIGNSMRNSQSMRNLILKEQTQTTADKQTQIKTVLVDPRGYEVEHVLSWPEEAPYIRIYCTFKNTSKEQVALEMFESFSLSGLSPYVEKDGPGSLNLHRIRAVWSQEGRHECIPVEDLQLEPAWSPHAVRNERYGQVGSMPVNKFFPFIAVEDKHNNIFWGAQLAHPASWQMEAYRKDDALCISGGLADRDFGHWLKNIPAGERFTTPEAIVSVAATDCFEEFTNRLVEAATERINQGPSVEQDLPIIFNEYCTTWGNPSHNNICEIVDCIRDKGFEYFVIDCGWYKENGVPWDISMGDYVPSKDLFPDGLDKTVAKIKEAGMIPGIWFEIENVGEAAKTYNNTDHLLHKDGSVLTTYARRFWNMCDPWVEEYLTNKVIGTLKDYGFGYMKVDYNETIGVGCDGAESMGEALRQNMEATQTFFKKVKKEVPGIILENCASGGHRLEPSFMGLTSMASFSDAHECPEIPIVAADLHRVIHPRQSQIWAVIRSEDSLKRIAYSVINTFLGRMCISGDVTKLDDKQWKVIDDGMAFYRVIAPIIKEGQSYHFGNKIESIRHPKGWQGILRVGKNGESYGTIHTFGGQLPGEVTMTLPKGYKNINVFSDTEETVQIKDGKLIYRPVENWKAVAVYLS